MEVEFGKEALKFENGAFSYFGVPAVMPTGINPELYLFHLTYLVSTSCSADRIFRLLNLYMFCCIRKVTIVETFFFFTSVCIHFS